MSKHKANYTELTHHVLERSSESLSVNEIVARVNEIVPITNRNPQNTIRNIVGRSRLIVNLGDGRYGWKLRLITGSVVRLTLTESDLAGERIELGPDLQEALWPAFFAVQKRQDLDPIQVELPDGTMTRFSLIHQKKPAYRGTSGSAEFWAWFESLGAAVGDHLIFSIVDGEAKSYRVAFQARIMRDEAAVAKRNQTIMQAALAQFRRQPYGQNPWGILAFLLSAGYYQHPIPPDPFYEIWTPDIYLPYFPHR